VRDGYLAGWRARGVRRRFVSAETEHEQPLGNLRLVGRIDRIDRWPTAAFVIDYKTESSAVTKDRVKHPTRTRSSRSTRRCWKTTRSRAAYVNVGERGGTQTVEQTAVVRGARCAGGRHHRRPGAHRVRRGPAGAGRGRVCEFCAARGLCRKDAWHLK
jgi:ATP-dependent helicase/nuclease subunit B